MARRYTLRSETTERQSGIDYRKELNEEQYAAVTASMAPDSSALVIAGAGSGKTRTLTYRVAWLMDHGVAPWQILLLTFTNKAAREMTARVQELIPQNVRDIWSGTFHSICNRILRRHAELLGFDRSFSILDSDDQKRLISAVVADSDIATSDKRFPKAAVLAGMFSFAVNTQQSLGDVIIKKYPYFLDWEEEILKVWDAYVTRKQDTNSMDFDDLLVKALELLEKNPQVREQYRRQFRHILVDEFQDTNAVQSALVDSLSGGGAAVMVVGDDAQSIYSWRGADMQNILSFPARRSQCEVFKIETNYRSVPEILELSNAAIQANELRIEKNLRSARDLLGMRPVLVPLEDARSQAGFVAQRILELRDEGVKLEEMAVLYRAHFHSMDVQMELMKRGIPFVITSGLRFFEQAHIKDIAAFLRFVSNRKDETSFVRILELMPGIGIKTAQKLWRKWLATGWASRAELPSSWPEVLALQGVPKKALKSWEQLGYIFDEMTAGGKLAHPGDMIFSVLEGIYDDYLRNSYENYESRRADIETLREYSGSFEEVEEFLSELSLLGSVDGTPSGRQEETDAEKITLSSVHQAKGLEWRVVFVIWLTEGGFPNRRVLDTAEQKELEEERRLFYVALTRAKDELYLSYPMMSLQSYSGDVILRPSRFLSDFPDDLVESWEVMNGSSDPF